MEQIIPIHAWNPVWRSNAVKADTEALMPTFMFKPSIELLDLLQQGALPNNIIEIDIAGTNSLYDGIHKVMIDRSSMIGGDRPNYFATTNIYIATLYERDWFSYPPVNGVFKLRKGILNDYKTNPVPEERMVQVVGPKPKIIEKYEDTPVALPTQPAVDQPVTVAQQEGELPYIPLHTMPSLGAVAAGVYDSTVNAAYSFGVPVSYMYNEYRVPPSAITRTSDKPIVENFCGCAGAFAPYAQSSRSNLGYDQDATVERFMMDPRSSSSMNRTTAVWLFILCLIVIGLFYAGLKYGEKARS